MGYSIYQEPILGFLLNFTLLFACCLILSFFFVCLLFFIKQILFTKIFHAKNVKQFVKVISRSMAVKSCKLKSANSLIINEKIIFNYHIYVDEMY